jgi:HEPN domain-containing protein
MRQMKIGKRRKKLRKRTIERCKHFFLAHLSVEKLLKALFVQAHNTTPPFIHDLYVLAVKAEIELSDETIAKLKQINGYNIEARYPEYKNDLAKRATSSFVLKELSAVREVRLWLLKKIKHTQS